MCQDLSAPKPSVFPPSLPSASDPISSNFLLSLSHMLVCFYGVPGSWEAGGKKRGKWKDFLFVFIIFMKGHTHAHTHTSHSTRTEQNSVCATHIKCKFNCVNRGNEDTVRESGPQKLVRSLFPCYITLSPFILLPSQTGQIYIAFARKRTCAWT